MKRFSLFFQIAAGLAVTIFFFVGINSISGQTAEAPSVASEKKADDSKPT